MIKKLDTTGMTEEMIQSFVFKTSPFSEPTTPRFQYAVRKFLNYPEYVHLEAMDEVDTVTLPNQKMQKYFMLWRSQIDRNALFCGTAFISDFEATRGINLRDYELLAVGLGGPEAKRGIRVPEK